MNLKQVGTNTVFCGGEARYEVEMNLLGQPSPGDSVYVLLPSGVTLKADSYKSLLNAPNTAPTPIPGGFRVALPTNMGGGIGVKFQFDALLSQSAGCIDQTIVVQTRVRSTSLCVSTGQPCAVYVSTGEAFLKIEPLRPELVIGNVSLSLSANDQITAEVVVNNVGVTPASGATVQLWSDLDGNGLLSAADVLRQTLTNSQAFQPGTSLPLSGVLNLGPQQLCGLLAVLPAAENCACAAQVFPLENFALSHAERKLCDKSPVQVGVAQRPGASYEWKTPALLACTTCATTTLVPDPNLPPGQSQVLVLEESSPGCRTVHRFTLSFGQTATASANNSAICKGKSVTLSAFGEAATQYAWSGQGLLNPAAAQSTASPATSQTYFVTVTFAGGCTATASVSVAVLNSDSVQLPVRTTCPGTPVQMPGKLTDQAGIYSFTYPKSNGCDSTVWQQLKVLDKISTSANLSACRGDTLWVFGKPVTQNTQECRPFIASN
ncbi:MAG TPA: hypothetical protein PK858_08340, partial [Saprospiraceae bacterium]|nr:hypothetical protein [Saprospiraceae bacterium]